MNYNDIFKLTLAGIIVLIIGAGLGYFYAPDKVKTVEKVVEKEKIIHEKDTKTTKQYDPNTGKIIKETQETTDKVVNANETKTDKETEKSKDQKHYAVKVGVVKSLNNTNMLTYRAGAEVRLPLFNSWAGLEGDIDVKEPRLGAYLRVEF